jgi:hypothetical protein
MSQTNCKTNTPILIEDEVKSIRKRAPTLSAKYSKFIQYSYYLINTFCKYEGLELDQAKLNQIAHTFGDIDEQETFVKGFLDNTKDIVQDMKLTKKLAAKAVKDQEKQERAAVRAAETKANKKPRKSAAKKTIIGENELINELVKLAINDVPVIPVPVSVPVPVIPVPAIESPELVQDDYISGTGTGTIKEADQIIEPKAGKAVKTKAEKVEKVKAVKVDKAETVVKAKTKAEKVEKSPVVRKQKAKKAVVVPEPIITVEPENGDDDGGIDVELITINDIEYQIDADNNLYNSDNEPVGVYIKETNSITCI